MKSSAAVAGGLAAMALLCFLCVRYHAPQIERDIYQRASARLESNGIPSSGLLVSGRDAQLSGAPDSRIVSNTAVNLVAGVSGVRQVTTAIVLGRTTQAPLPEPEPLRAQLAAIVRAHPIEFADASAFLSKDNRAVVDSIAPLLKNSPETRLRIVGHTDSTGAAAHNLILSERRAQSVRSRLVMNGVPAAQLKPEGLGSSRPIASNDTPEGRKKNRRIEFVVEERN